MNHYLVFTLGASIGAMGDLAGHERRGSDLWPARSAIIGLLGAALGLRREDDFSSLDKLEISIASFMPEMTPGFRDFHTVQTVPSAQAKAPNSRPQALRQAGLKRNTTLTLRDYRCDLMFGVAVCGQELAALHKALLRPVFTLYFGRKSCPLSVPLAPQIVEVADSETALGHVRLPFWHQVDQASKLYVDASPEDLHVHYRYDQASDRKSWHFSPRKLAVRKVHIKAQKVSL